MRRILSILFVFIVGYIYAIDTHAQQLPDGYRKFLGVWNCEPPKGGFGNIKVIETEGKLVVHIKTNGEIKTCKNTKLDGKRLYFSFNGLQEWGKWTIKNGKIVTESGGTDGEPTRIYDSFRYGNKTADESQTVWYFYFEENAEDDMDLFYHCAIYYLKDDRVLFEQASTPYIHYRKYTNW